MITAKDGCRLVDREFGEKKIIIICSNCHKENQLRIPIARRAYYTVFIEDDEPISLVYEDNVYYKARLESGELVWLKS